MRDERIDFGRAFDWGNASEDYAKYRDIYPETFYNKIVEAGLCIKGQAVLDLGTGTGVLPRNLYQYGANFIGTDPSPNQVGEAIRISRQAGMDIPYKCCSAEDADDVGGPFDVISACQCFFYFHHDIVAGKLFDLLKPGGQLLVLYMAWLPQEDKIAGASEDLVLKFNPEWSGCGESRHTNVIPDQYLHLFDIIKEDVYDLFVPFTRETWNGRMRACRGIGASLPQERVQEFSSEHLELLNKIAPPKFEVMHYVAMTILQVKK